MDFAVRSSREVGRTFDLLTDLVLAGAPWGWLGSAMPLVTVDSTIEPHQLVELLPAGFFSPSDDAEADSYTSTARPFRRGSAAHGDPATAVRRRSLSDLDRRSRPARAALALPPVGAVSVWSASRRPSGSPTYHPISSSSSSRSRPTIGTNAQHRAKNPRRVGLAVRRSGPCPTFHHRRTRAGNRRNTRIHLESRAGPLPTDRRPPSISARQPSTRNSMTRSSCDCDPTDQEQTLPVA